MPHEKWPELEIIRCLIDTREEATCARLLTMPIEVRLVLRVGRVYTCSSLGILSLCDQKSSHGTLTLAYWLLLTMSLSKVWVAVEVDVLLIV